MYWSIHQYPSLRDRPPAEREAVLRAALKENRRSYGVRLLVVFAAVAAGAIAATFKLSPHARLLDWRTWLAPALGAVFIYGYLLLEINGAVHTSVQKYLESNQRPRRKQT
jgi:hypothetical protein